ncbi:phosphonate metabolism transcriptional regulator PhnF [Azospirillum halopraeferens]|uniref:phosphonate metabolism transcriptional regulator PhnF n=1 Tax=Azospirillum halopraeferens TaxID=34010 RepID=UPI0004255C9D|nr:phosphonate metabolism transcriptional regulator PhnF [Azospirillum halopraeferens]
MNGSQAGAPPLWRRIADRLGEEIDTGLWRPGDRLPSEAQLATRFGVNRHTLRRAVAELAAAGRLRVEQGRGTFVPPMPLLYRLGHRTRFSEAVLRQNRQPAWDLVRADIAPARGPVATALALRDGEPVIVLETLGTVDGRPVLLSDHRSPAERFPRLIDAFRSEGSITAALRRLGVEDYTRRSTRLAARPADPQEMRLLDLARGAPVLVSEGVNVDRAGVPIQWSLTRFAADRVEIVVDGDPGDATAESPAAPPAR